MSGNGDSVSAVLTDDESAYEALEGAPELELAKLMTSAGSPTLGGGCARFATDGEFATWTLGYDEVVFVLSGALTFRWGGGSVSGGPGEILVISMGATVFYQGTEGTKSFFVVHPRDWAKRASGSLAGPSTTSSAETDGTWRPSYGKEEL